MTRLTLPTWVAWLAAVAGAQGALPCRIEVVEKGTGWPVPLVELRTTHLARLVSDNAGLIAFDLPELMGRETWFDVLGHGYEVPQDGFGYRGVRLTPRPGATLRVEVTRTLPARRLGRLTGAGIFAESQKLGLETHWVETGVLGCDSIQAAVHQGRRYWFWGDTTLARHPLGLFHMSGATTAERPLATWEPPLRLRFELFTNSAGAPRSVAPMPGEGPTWLTGVATVPDRTGRARLVAHYMKIKPPLQVYQWGQCTWNEATKSFERLRVLWTESADTPKPPAVPEGHPVAWRDGAGKDWLLFGNPLPRLRCPATFEAWQDPAAWEALTPQASVPSADGGQPIKPHSGSLAWNAFRGRWVTVFLQQFGKPSAFGELWYAEAPAPTGPWGPALKVVTHDNYTFYNPRLHPDLTPTNSPVLLFEGTYTMQFANKPAPTPRHDYNQILYRLDLDTEPFRKLPRQAGE